jgi:cellulose synthase/poly-beta-1,6-N-acetylglucosamine synthase-like glycosyltransferase
MESLSQIIFYIFAFLSIYVQVFLLITFLENKNKIVNRKGEVKLKEYPGVSVIVPCWNEEETIQKTVQSLLELNYPKDKLHILLIDDGSTDRTWEVISQFENRENIKIFRKENGGKHTALNLGLQHVNTEYTGCLDADSYVDPESLVRIMSYFERDPKIMAVAPSIIAREAKNIIQNAQKAEYYMSVYVKKMLGILGAIHVTPGPLTIFKKKVFDDLGPYRSAHSTEDMEIAYRMQQHHYRIEQCNDAYVYTHTPKTVKKLYKQRLRWIYGFINNTIDYRSLIFKKRYGNFAFFTVPAGVVSIFAVSFLFIRITHAFGSFLVDKFVQYQTIGFHLPSNLFNFDPFYINTQSFIFVTVVLYSLVIFSILLGHKMAIGKWKFPVNILYFFSIYSLIAPFWLLKAIYNTARSKKPSWR